MLQRHERLLSDAGADTRSCDPAVLEVLLTDLRHPDDAVRGSAAEALGQLGPVAAPAAEALATRVDAERPTVWDDAAYDPDAVDVRRRAVDALRRIGPGARAAVPALLRDLLSVDACSETDGTLDAIGPDALPELVDALTGEKRGGQRRLEKVIARLGPPALEPLRALLVDETQPPERRLGAASSLGLMGPDAAPAVAALLACAEAPAAEPELRRAAITALGRMGPTANDAIPHLVGLLGDVRVGAEARCTLGEIGARAVPALVEALDAKDPGVGAAARDVLRLGGHEEDLVLDRLVEDLSDSDKDVRYRALVGLAEVGRAATVAFPSVRALIMDEEEDSLVRAEAIRTIRCIGPRDAAVGLLMSLFTHHDWHVRSTAATTVAACSPPPHPELVRVLIHGSVNARCAAAKALGHARPVDGHVVHMLRIARRDEDEDVRNAAMVALSRMVDDVK